MEKEINDIDSIPRGESIAFSSNEKPMGEIEPESFED